MSIAKHIIHDHGGFGDTQSVRMAQAVNVANLIGGGAGQSIVTAVAFAAPMPDATYSVQVTPHQDAVAFVTAKTVSGFNVTLTPRLAADTLAAGTFDVLVTA
jgi:hypothetical protein